MSPEPKSYDLSHFRIVASSRRSTGAGHRRRFSEADRRHILAEAAKPGVNISEITRRYGIARRMLCRWSQEDAATPGFVDVEIVGEEVAP